MHGAAGWSEPAWVRHAIVWQVFPLGALGAPSLCPDGDPDDPSSPAGRAAGEHRLRRLLPWLDHLVRLGANVLQLGPVLHSMSHGYDTVDYFRVDPRLGTNEDLADLIAAAHERGVRVLLDGVFNHTGIAYPDFARLPLLGPTSPQAAMYHLDWVAPPLAADGQGTDLEPATTCSWVPGQAPAAYRRFEGQDWLAELNHDCPAVADLVSEVMTYWCERGVDGWRLDAAYAVAPSFWRQVLPRVREHFTDLYVYGEVIHGDYGALVGATVCEVAGAAGAGGGQPERVAGLDAVTQYELWQAVWHGLAEANLYELDWCLRRHAALLEGSLPPGSQEEAPQEEQRNAPAPDDPASGDLLHEASGGVPRRAPAGRRGFVPWTFLSNHDTTRVASQLAAPAAATSSTAAGSAPVTPCSRLPHAVALLAMLPGTPCVYYGDEEGWAGVKEHRLGGDDAVRPPLPAAPPDQPGASPGLPAVPLEQAGSGAPVPDGTTTRAPAAPSTVEGLAPERVRALYQELLGLRRRLPWLHDATMRTLHLDNHLYALALAPRPCQPAPDGGEEPEAEAGDGVVLTLSLEEHEAWLPTDGAHRVLAHGTGADLLADPAPRQQGPQSPPPRAVRDGVVLAPGGWAVLARR